jgi:tetratricopeptide (TPR) repeat protein
MESLRQAPVTVPGMVTLALFVVWATDQAGYPVTHWAPGGLIVGALLLLALTSVPLRLREIPLSVRIAALCLGGYTALSFLSILWAGAPGDAWEGADRTLLYLLVFVLFACWRQQGASAVLLLACWTLALIALAAFTALHVNDGSLASLLPGGRLVYPTGYPNANAAQWLMAFWPAVLLARSERLWWGLRGVLAGGAVLLAAVALLSQSRGSLFATPVMLVLVFALLPGRLRTFAVLVPVAAGVGAIVPAVLRVGSRLEHGGGNARQALHSATLAMFVAALAVGLVVAAAAALESRLRLSPSSTARVRRGVGVAAVVALVAVLAGGWALAGNPVTRLEHGWQSFKGGYGSSSRTGSRLVSGLGSNRYDFYRVALNEFSAHPLAGIGADNFAQQYLLHRRSSETPHYPHSVELRTLTETGLLGGLLALVGLAAALVAGMRAAWSPEDPLARTVAAAALAGFGYWAVHGSVDWFWEFAGLGAPAFALLGLACALTPRERRGERAEPAREVTVVVPEATVALAASGAAQTTLARPWPMAASDASGAVPPSAAPSRGAGPRRPAFRRLAVAAVALAGAMAVVVAFAAPWLSQLEVQSAARVWEAAPATAYARLGDAARLNPLGDEPYLVAGSIALRFGDLERADHEFALALKRVPDDAYATLERGAIASSRGEARLALVLLERAAQLNPRDPLTRQALLLARAGRRIDVEELNRSILSEAQQLS